MIPEPRRYSWYTQRSFRLRTRRGCTPDSWWSSDHRSFTFATCWLVTAKTRTLPFKRKEKQKDEAFTLGEGVLHSSPAVPNTRTPAQKSSRSKSIRLHMNRTGRCNLQITIWYNIQRVDMKWATVTRRFLAAFIVFDESKSMNHSVYLQR